VAAGRLVRLTSSQEWQETERRPGNVVLRALAAAIAVDVRAIFRGIWVAAQVVLVERPMAVRGLVPGQEAQPARDGGFGERIAATLQRHTDTSGTAAAAEAAGHHDATQAARQSDQRRFTRVGRIEAFA